VSQLDSALATIRQQSDLVPQFAIILGSGLGGVVDHIEDPVVLSFADIPGFMTSTAGGHRGQLVLGTIGGVAVVAMAGRLHRYGGWTTDQVTFPVRVMRALGATRLIVSNAAGGVQPRLVVGDIVVIHDHVDWMTGRPYLRFHSSPTTATQPDLANDQAHATATNGGQPNGEPSNLAEPPRWQPIDVPRRSPQVYDPSMMATAFAAARRGRFTAHPGVYLATLGPNYETRAEYRMMRRLGADVVGMSTVPEVLTAASLGMRILALSMVSNVACPDAPRQALHAEVLAAGRQAEPRMLQIVTAVLAASND